MACLKVATSESSAGADVPPLVPVEAPCRPACCARMASGNNTNSVTITDTLQRIRDFLSCRFGMKNGLAVLIRAPLLDKFTRRRRGGAEIEKSRTQPPEACARSFA